MPEHYEPDTGSKSKTYQSIAVYDGSDPAYFKNWHAKVLSHYATWLNGEDRAGHWKQHLVSDGCFIDMPSSDLDDRYLKLFRPHLAADKLNRNIRSHRHAESRFRHARDERIGDWQNRQRVLFADVQKFLDGTALTALKLCCLANSQQPRIAEPVSTSGNAPFYKERCSLPPLCTEQTRRPLS